MRFTKEQIEEARNTDLYEYLVNNHDEDYKIRPECLRMEDDNSVYIKAGSNLWIDWSDYSGGDAIDFLRIFYGYSFKGAVIELLSGGSGETRALVKRQKSGHDNYKNEDDTCEYVIPEKANTVKNVYAYLTKTRKLPGDVVSVLIRNGLLYQDSHNNAVFINKKQDRCEIVGTNTFVEKFKGTRHKSKDCFWWFGCGNTIYLTEGAIDAVSLCVLLNYKPAIYASLPGVGNQSIIDRIVADGKYHVILAVDNDEAGQKCRDRNPGLETMIPPSPYKDWNEMLQAGATLDDTSYMEQVG